MLFSQTIGDAERAAAVARLESSRDAFVRSIERVSEAQWKFKPSPDRWSIADCAEHIVLTEESYLAAVNKLLASEPSGKRAELSDADLLKLYTDRSNKRTAPERLQPSGRWRTPSEVIAAFRTVRAKSIALARETQAPLRQLAAPAAAGGKWMDGYQWFLRIAGHSERHTAQLEEVKEAPGFPK